PGEMIAGEEELLAPEEDGVASGVAGSGNHQETGLELDRRAAGRLELDRGGGGADVVAMDDPVAAEALVELLMIGDVVLMREDHPPHAAEALDVLHQRAGEAGRVDEDVPFLASDEIAERAEGRLGGEAAAVDVIVNELGICC